MSSQAGTPSDAAPRADDLVALMPEVVTIVQRWLAVAAVVPADRSAARLTGVLKDPGGLRFTIGFVDGVMRPEDPSVAARKFALLARDVPRFLPWYLRVAIRMGARAGVLFPRVTMSVVRRVLRRMVGHLVIDVRDARLTRAIRRIRRDGAQLNINLLGEAVLGNREAVRRLENIRQLLARDDIDYVSVKVSSTVAPQNPWAFDETVSQIVESMTPLFRRAAQSAPKKFINLDMEEYRDLELTVAVFNRVLDQPEFLDLEAGIVLQAYLPDALSTMIELQQWAAARRARGGAAIKVRLVKGANLPMERVEATIHGWPLATWQHKQETDTHYKRILDYALWPDRIENVHIGVAGHNLFDIAFAWLLSQRREVAHGVGFEMLLGMAPGYMEAVKRDVGSVRLYTPVVHPREFDVAIAYLVRRLEEGASQENFLSAVSDLNADKKLFDRELSRFVQSMEALDRSVPGPRRVQDRRLPVHDLIMNPFRNIPDTDPSLRANTLWANTITARIPVSHLGDDMVAASMVTSADALDACLESAAEAGRLWGSRTGAERATVLRNIGIELERRRAQLLEVMVSECVKTFDQGDPEVSEAIDFANYYASLAEELAAIDGAVARLLPVTVVTPPWNFPIAITAGSTLAALAAGSAVVMKPAPQARRCGAILVESMHAAGVPSHVLQMLNVDENDLGRQLVSDPRVDRVILTGSYETAELFRSFRPDLPLFAETSGKNAIVVTPSADIDLAVKDIVRSAFGHAGQKCSAASLVILVGRVATSARFRRQLVDAVTSLTVGSPADPATQMGPLIEPAAGKLLHALTTLDTGESWVVEPRQLDSSGRLWSPGVKEGVTPGSPAHLTEYFGPVLGIMTARSLDEAIEFQNAVPYGLTAGLFSLEQNDIDAWLARVEAGNLYVNRQITGAIVRRQPFGGWKRSSVGTGTKAGGPSYLIGLTGWAPAAAERGSDLGPTVSTLLRAAQDDNLPGLEGLERALRSDAHAWESEFDTVRDVSQVAVERNVLRYLPHPVVVRLASGSVTPLVRVVAAGVLAGAKVVVSSCVEIPAAIRGAFAASGVELIGEADQQWAERLRNLEGARVRLIGGDPAETSRIMGPRPDIAVYAESVTEAGRIELLPFLREQAISITAHRYGTPDPLSENVLVERPAGDAA